MTNGIGRHHLNFKSNTYRIFWNENMFRTGCLFTSPPQYAELSDCMALSLLPTIKTTTRKTELYSRKSTGTLVGTLENEGFSCVYKIFATNEEGRNEDGHLPEYEVEMRYLCILTDMMRDGNTYGSVIPLGMKVTDLEMLTKQGYIDKYQMNKLSGFKRYVILFTERADCSLTSFMDKICDTVKSNKRHASYRLEAILFQCMFILSSIQKKFPSFRHNDLHTSNILVQHIDCSKTREFIKDMPPNYPMMIQFSVEDSVWHIDLAQCPFRLLIWDMSFSSIRPEESACFGAGLVAPRKRRFGFKRHLDKTISNTYVDVHRLIDTMRYVLERNNVSNKEIVYQFIRLLKKIVPDSLSLTMKKNSERNKIKIQEMVQQRGGEDEEFTPIKIILNTPLFSKFRVDHIHEKYRIKPISMVHID
jgi:hypothetical protein